MTDEERAATEALAREEAEAQADDREVEQHRRDDPANGQGTRDLVAAAASPGSDEAPTTGDEVSSTPLFGSDDADEYRGRWQEIQARFVDDPQQAVQDADNLVAELMKELARMFANERSGLERQWERGTDASTEDLRVALRRYRSFFSRLLTI